MLITCGSNKFLPGYLGAKGLGLRQLTVHYLRCTIGDMLWTADLLLVTVHGMEGLGLWLGYLADCCLVGYLGLWLGSCSLMIIVYTG